MQSTTPSQSENIPGKFYAPYISVCNHAASCANAKCRGENRH